MKNILFCFTTMLLICAIFIGCSNDLLSRTGSSTIPIIEETSNIMPIINEDSCGSLLADKLRVTYIGLSKAERSEAETKLNSDCYFPLHFRYFDSIDGYIPDGSPTCYGKFGDCSVWVILGQACWIDEKEVAGFKFIFSSSFAIKVYRSGEVYDLADAYKKGVLTEEDIAMLYQIHKEFVIRYYSLEFLYEYE